MRLLSYSDARRRLALESGQFHRRQGFPPAFTVFDDDVGENTSTYVESGGEPQVSRLQRSDQIVDDAVGHCLVKSLVIAIGPDVELEAFQLDAFPVGNVIQHQGRKIGLAGFRTKTGKLRNFHVDMIIPRRCRVGKNFQVFCRAAGHSLILVKSVRMDCLAYVFPV